MEKLKFTQKSSVDFNSTEGKELVRNVFRHLLSLNAQFASTKISLDEWNLQKNLSSKLGVSRTNVSDAIRYLVECKCLTYIKVNHDSPFRSKNVKITQYGLRLWEQSTNREIIKERPQTTKKRNPYSSLFYFGKRKNLTTVEIKEIAYRLMNVTSLTELTPHGIHKVLQHIKGRSPEYLKKYAKGEIKAS